MEATGTIGQANSVIPLNSETNSGNQSETVDKEALNTGSINGSPIVYSTDTQQAASTPASAQQHNQDANISDNFVQQLKDAITNFIQKMTNLFMQLFQSLSTRLNNQSAPATDTNTASPNATSGLNGSDSNSTVADKTDTGTDAGTLNGGSSPSIDNTTGTHQAGDTNGSSQASDTPATNQAGDTTDNSQASDKPATNQPGDTTGNSQASDKPETNTNTPEQQQAEGDGKIKAMTYNVLYNSHNGSPTGAADAVESLVRQNQQPDLVSLQEVDDKATYDAIADRMTGMDYGKVGNWRGSVQQGAGNMEFYKNSTFNKLGEDYFDSGVQNRGWERGAELATLKVKNGPNQGKTILAGATHGPPDSGQDKFNQSLGGYIANHDDNVDGVVIGGDWNDQASDVARGTGLDTQSAGSSPIDFQATKNMTTESVTPVGHNGSDHSAVVSTLDFK